MASDCGHELKSANVAMIALWPGSVTTEYTTNAHLNERDDVSSN